MADSQHFSLQVWPTPNKEKESLKYLISRINDQKGSFRNVTEQSLEQELKDSENNIAVPELQKESQYAKDESNAQNQKDEVYKVREEVLKQVGFVI